MANCFLNNKRVLKAYTYFPFLTITHELSALKRKREQFYYFNISRYISNASWKRDSSVRRFLRQLRVTSNITLRNPSGITRVCTNLTTFNHYELFLFIFTCFSGINRFAVGVSVNRSSISNNIAFDHWNVHFWKTKIIEVT